MIPRLVPILTRRCRVSPLSPGDAPALAAITDASVTARVHFLPQPFTPADALALIEGGKGGHRFHGVWAREGADLLGVIGVNPKGNYVIEVGYWFAAPARGQGLAAEAVEATLAALADRNPQCRIVAECRPDNRRSQHLLERVGFHATGAPGERPGRMLFAWAAQSPSSYRFDVC
jgi:RimJ/RimL family protein N-acetyltransferase